MRLITWVVVTVAVAACAIATTALADPGMVPGSRTGAPLLSSGARDYDVLPGYDYFVTGHGSYVQFGGGTPNPVLPADFFGPGSDPFDGIIYFDGQPIDPAAYGDVSTIVERLNPALLPDPFSSSATIDIQLLELSLVSTAPIIVTYNGGQNPTEYMVTVVLNPAEPSLGQMTIHHQTEGGGIYTDVWAYVYPRFDFLPLGPGEPAFLEPLDPYLLEGLGPYGWQHSPTYDPLYPSAGPNFFPTDPMEDAILYWPFGPPFVQIGAHPVVPLVSCCLPDLTCITTTTEDCRARGGWTVPVCLGDLNGNGADDACEIVPPDYHASPDDQSWVNFGTELIPPIPADFFGPGSDPFEGQVVLKGDPMEPDVLGGSSTILRRADDPVLPGDPAGTEGTVELQILELSLVSSAPITVTYSGGSPEDWNVSVGLSTVPAPAGWLTATKTHANGGTFDSMIYVQPVFIFTQVGGSSTQVLDLGEEGNPPLEMYATGQPFVHAVYEDLDVYYDPDANWVAGVDEVTPGDPSSQTLVEFLVATIDPVVSVGHGVIPPPPPREPVVKWEQLPDLDTTGMDVNATFPLVVLADDFPCEMTGPITDIYVWGSWYQDFVPDPANVLFTLSFHSDIPVGPDGWSIPGDILWMRPFAPGEFTVETYAGGLMEGWYDPMEGFYEPFGDTICFLYHFHVPEGEEFIQQGTPGAPIIYWLDVQAQSLDTPDALFGWKTSTMHWNDDAVWGMGEDPPMSPWFELRYPPGHPWMGDSIDLAFRIIGEEGAPEGACCLTDYTCIQTTESDCVAQGGVYEGDGTICGGIEACCLQDNSCVNVDALCCVVELGGTPMGPGTLCSAPEACCFTDGTCDDLDPLCCTALGGAPQSPGTACTTPQACCLSDGDCIMVDPLCCDEMGGTAQGSGTACTEPEACCFDDGGCQELDPLCCVDQGGTPQGPQSVCGGMEACCLATGECRMADALCCVNELGGTPQGPGSLCTGPQACCFDGGACADLDPLCCADQGGSPRGPGSQCLGDNNGNTIDDACELIKWEQPVNTGLSGLHAHDWSGGTLVLADQWQCEGGVVTDIHWWGSYEAIGSGLAGFHLSIHLNEPGDPWCLPGPEIWSVDIFTGQFYEFPTGLVNNLGEPIYLYEYFLDVPFEQTQGEIYWLDIMAYSVDPFNPVLWKWQEMHRVPVPIICPAAERTDLNPWYPIEWPGPNYSDMAFRITSEEYEPLGACCLTDYTCVETTEDDCVVNLGGVFEGIGTICGGMEACCLQDGTCMDADALCCVNELGGTPQGAGTACTAPEACCLSDNTCDDLDPLCCVDQGGVPQGPGTACTATEACCLPFGACVDVDPLCCDELGGWLSGEPACLGDGNGNGMDDACEPDDLKWLQMPDLEPTGIDVEAMLWPTGDGILLADDFLCEQSGPITEIKVWGSWYHDFVIPDPGAAIFHLSFHADNPQGPGGWSEPIDPPLWVRTFVPGEYFFEPYMDGLVEGFYEPWPPPGFYDPLGDTICWLYTFPVPEGEEFFQEGSPAAPIVYWLDVQVELPGGEGVFGWKTSLNHWNDDAVWAYGSEMGHDPWQELIYPEQHPMHPESIDLAFMLIGGAGCPIANQPQPEVYSSPCTIDDDCPNEATCINSVCYAPKNRYISYQPNNPGSTVAFRVTHLGTGLQWWVDEPFEAPEDPGVWIARLTDTQICRVWNEGIVHVGDCQIVPVADYDIQAIDCTCDPSNEGNYSAALTLPTIPKPGAKFWADVVGPKVVSWSPPENVVNMDDVMAAVQKFKDDPTAPHITWVDVDGEVPNVILNMTDVLQIVNGFKGLPYPFSTPADCP